MVSQDLSSNMTWYNELRLSLAAQLNDFIQKEFATKAKPTAKYDATATAHVATFSIAIAHNVISKDPSYPTEQFAPYGFGKVGSRVGQKKGHMSSAGMLLLYAGFRNNVFSIRSIERQAIELATKALPAESAKARAKAAAVVGSRHISTPHIEVGKKEEPKLTQQQLYDKLLDEHVAKKAGVQASFEREGQTFGITVRDKDQIPLTVELLQAVSQFADLALSPEARRKLAARIVTLGGHDRVDADVKVSPSLGGDEQKIVNLIKGIRQATDETFAFYDGMLPIQAQLIRTFLTKSLDGSTPAVFLGSASVRRIWGETVGEVAQHNTSRIMPGAVGELVERGNTVLRSTIKPAGAAVA